jgi:hypothetical protein
MADHPVVRRESSDVRPALVGWLALIVAGIVVLVPVALWLAAPGSVHDPRHQPRVTPPEPRLQSTPRDDLAALRRAEDARLSSYGWSDRAAGLAHIPVEEAMQRIERDGIPDWPRTQP